MIPGLICTILASIAIHIMLDDHDNELWWYFITSMAGGLTAIINVFFINSIVVDGVSKTAWKSKDTVKFARKVVHRTAMSAIYFPMGLGTFTLCILFNLLENWYG